jgi:ribosomal protein S24E
MSQFGKKSAKVYHSLYSSTEQLQVALWTYIFLRLGY